MLNDFYPTIKVYASNASFVITTKSHDRQKVKYYSASVSRDLDTKA